MPSCKYERCNVQIRYKPKGQGWIASTGIVPKTNLKLRFVPVNDPLWKKFAILFRKNSWQHRFMFCVQISRKSAVRKWVKGCVVLVSSQNAAFFAIILRPFSAGRQQCAREVTCHLWWRLPVKYRPNRFRFAVAGVIISEKVISYNRNNKYAFGYIIISYSDRMSGRVWSGRCSHANAAVSCSHLVHHSRTV